MFFKVFEERRNMVLDFKTIRDIEEYVEKEPRSIQEISTHIGKSWKTTDEYVRKISEEYGTLTLKVFRRGSHGALKVVYSSALEKVSKTGFQERILNDIVNAKSKQEFNPFDIWQFIDDKKKNVIVEKFRDPKISKKQNIIEFLEGTENTLFVFTGNNSWINVTERKKPVLKSLDNILKKGANMKVVGRVDFSAFKNLEKLLALNKKYGEEGIEIKHSLQPLRGFIVDDRVVRLKEERDAREKIRVFYEIYDREWVAWLKKLFWKMFNSSVGAEKRIEELKKLDLAD